MAGGRRVKPAAMPFRPGSSAAAAARCQHPSGESSDLQITEIGHTGLHHIQVHFDKVVLDAAGSGGSEDLLPVQSILSDGHYLPGLGGPTLYVHGKEASGISHKIFRGIVAAAD